MSAWRSLLACGLVVPFPFAIACSGSDDHAGTSSSGTGGMGGAVASSGSAPAIASGGQATASGGAQTTGQGGSLPIGAGGMTIAGSGGAPPAGTSGAGGSQPPGTGGSSTAGGAGGMQSASGGMTSTGGAAQGGSGALPPLKPPGPIGPDGGDPSKPVVAIPNVPCRNPSAPGFGLGQPNLKVDNRDVIIDYPCDRHEGAPVTFILNLHGTTPENLRFYQWGYFSAYKYVGSHNLIIATPKSVVDQWGNGDNGQDEPYLMHVIAWVYANFTGFDIRAMWVGGHSWGSFYTSQFGCKPEIADRVKGLILMSGARKPACAASVSIINSAANLKPDPNDSTKTIVSPEALLDQASIAMGHGCDAAQMKAVDANNDETFWPNCDPGYVHANYLMKTKQHADSMDASVVQSIVDWVKLSRK